MRFKIGIKFNSVGDRVSVETLEDTPIAKGWCNRHQKEYNHSDCPTSSRGYPNREFYICPDCVADASIKFRCHVGEKYKTAIAKT